MKTKNKTIALQRARKEKSVRSHMFMMTMPAQLLIATGIEKMYNGLSWKK